LPAAPKQNGHPTTASSAPAFSLPGESAASGEFRLKDSFAQAERDLLHRALQQSNGVLGGPNGAAARLGLKRQTLQSKLKKYGLEPEDFRRRQKVS